jgi:hypothetical protein
MASAPECVSYAYGVLMILSLLNLLNYVDRFIFAALLPHIKQYTGYTDQQLGWGAVRSPSCTPVFGYLGDRVAVAGDGQPPQDGIW